MTRIETFAGGSILTSGDTAAAEYVPVGKLKPWANNPRKNDAAVAGVAASIERFGFGAPLLARRETGEIIAGHTRLKAALKLKLAQVPVRYLDLSADEAHALALADNKLGELADWDEEMLSAVLKDLSARDISTDEIGFGEGELNRLLSDRGENIPLEEWSGMPECESEDQTAWGSVKVNFASASDMHAFAKLIGQTITEQTRSVWYPPAEIGRYADKSYGAKS